MRETIFNKKTLKLTLIAALLASFLPAPIVFMVILYLAQEDD